MTFICLCCAQASVFTCRRVSFNVGAYHVHMRVIVGAMCVRVCLGFGLTGAGTACVSKSNE